MTTASMPLFYNSVVALDRKAHERLRTAPPNEFRCARGHGTRAGADGGVWTDRP